MNHELRNISKSTGDVSEYAPFPEKLTLCCGQCGKEAWYDVGAIFWGRNTSRASAGKLRGRKPVPFEDQISFSNYFRCVNCHASGPWTFSEETRFRILQLSLALTLDEDDEMPVGFYHGVTVMFDGTQSPSPAWSEDYLRGLIEKNPDDFFLHNRLGNILLKAGMADLARTEFLRAIELNPEDISSLDQLGDMALEENHPQEALKYYIQVLQHARHSHFLMDRERWQIVDNVLLQLLDMDALQQAMQQLNQHPSESLSSSASSASNVVYLTEFDLAVPADWNRLINMFLYEPGEEPFDPDHIPVPPFMKAAGQTNSDPSSQFFSKSLFPEEHEDADEFECLVPIHRATRRVSRNEQCPCSSGKKYKHCCGKH